MSELPLVTLKLAAAMRGIFVDRLAAAASADGVLLSGTAAFNRGIGAACAGFAGATGDLCGRSILASFRKLYNLFVNDEYHFFMVLSMSVAVFWRVLHGTILGKVALAVLQPQIFGDSTGTDTLLLVRMGGLDRCVISGCTVSAGSTGNLSGIGRIGELIIHDNNKPSYPA